MNELQQMEEEKKLYHNTKSLLSEKFRTERTMVLNDCEEKWREYEGHEGHKKSFFDYDYDYYLQNHNDLFYHNSLEEFKEFVNKCNNKGYYKFHYDSEFMNKRKLFSECRSAIRSLTVAHGKACLKLYKEYFSNLKKILICAHEQELAVINKTDLLNLEKVTSNYVICANFYKREVLGKENKLLPEYLYESNELLNEIKQIEKNRALIAQRTLKLNIL